MTADIKLIIALALIGPSGNGKTSLGTALSTHYGRPFIDGDDYHDLACKEQMGRGIGLTDEQRSPWLKRVRRGIEQHLPLNNGTSNGNSSPVLASIVACSLLAPIHREQVQPAGVTMAYVYQKVPDDVLLKRVRERKAKKEHFMSPELVESQIKRFEVPAGALVLDGMLDTSTLMLEVTDWLASRYKVKPNLQSAH